MQSEITDYKGNQFLLVEIFPIRGKMDASHLTELLKSIEHGKEQ